MIHRPLSILLTALAWIPGLSLAAATDTATEAATGSEIEELIVSGYRSVTPQELDTSITLIDGETIRLATLSHFEELVPLVPNMNYSGEGSRARYFQLRGIGEREQYEGAPNPSVGFIVDDIDLSGIGGVSASHDLQQVDVLRGPQSARYGSSALAGVVYLQSAIPADELTGSLEVSGGNEEIFNVGAAVGGPLSDRVKGRMSVFYFEDSGFRHNEFYDKSTNGRQELSLRGKLSWELGNDWELLLSALHTDFDNGYDAFTITNDSTTRSNDPGEDSQQTTAGSLKISGPLSAAATFTSITSLARSDVNFSFDGDWGNTDFWQTYGNYGYEYEYLNPRDRQTISQEFRLVSTPEGRLFSDSTDWVVGAYQRLEEDSDISSTGLYSDVGEENFCVPACLTDRQIESRFESRTFALFGGTDTRFTDRLGLSLGLRFERWEADYEDVWTDINYAGPPDSETCNVTEIDCRPRDDLWGGHIALNYDLTDTTRTYLRVARGFKAGGFNPSLAALQGDGAALGSEFLRYGDETLLNYELGLKGIWANGSLQADLALFYMDRKDAQLSQSSQQVPFDPNSFVFVTYNGAADVYGLEVAGSWQLTSAWELHGTLGLLDTEVQASEKTADISPNAIGRDLAHAPRYTANVGASYFSETGWFGRLDLNAVDSFYFDISHNQKSRAYQTVNLRIGKSWGQWSLSAWGRNLFDEDYATRGFYFGVEPPDFAPVTYTRFGTPRTYGLTLRYDL